LVNFYTVFKPKNKGSSARPLILIHLNHMVDCVCSQTILSPIYGREALCLGPLSARSCGREGVQSLPQMSGKIFCVCISTVKIGPIRESELKLILNSHILL